MNYTEEWTKSFGPEVAAIVAQTPERLARRGLRIVGGEDYPRVADDNDNILLVMYSNYDRENTGGSETFLVEREDRPDAFHFSPALVASNDPRRCTPEEIHFELISHSSIRRSELHDALMNQNWNDEFWSLQLCTYPVYHLQKCRPGETYVLTHDKKVTRLEDIHQIKIAPIEEIVLTPKSAAE